MLKVEKKARSNSSASGSRRGSKVKTNHNTSNQKPLGEYSPVITNTDLSSVIEPPSDLSIRNSAVGKKADKSNSNSGGGGNFLMNLSSIKNLIKSKDNSRASHYKDHS